MNKEELLQIINSPTPVIVKFGVEKWCQACDQFRPIFDKFSQERNDCFIYEKPSLNDKDDVMNEYWIERYPSTVVFQNGVEVHRVVGVLTKDSLNNITKTLKNITIQELEKYNLTTTAEYQAKQLEITKLQLDSVKLRETLFDIQKEFTRREQEQRLGEAIATEIKPVEDFSLPPRTVDESTLVPCTSWCQ